MATITINHKTYSSKFDIGNTIGRLRVINHPVHRAALDATGKKPRRQWYYPCQCACGAKVTKSQEALQKKRVMCDRCAFIAREDVKGPKMLPEGVPDFAQLPAPSLVPGPECY